MANLNMVKDALRKEIQNKISKIAKEDRQRQSEAVYQKGLKVICHSNTSRAQQILSEYTIPTTINVNLSIIRAINLKTGVPLSALQAFKSSKRVSIFLSTEDEIDTEPMLRKMFEDGKSVYVPRYKKSGMQMVRLHSMEDWKNLPLTKWNIKQPSFKEEREDALETGGLDLIIVPGVAFTKEGDRLGHGAGYYDSFLTKIKASQEVPPTTIALTFEEQVLNEVPVSERDVKIDLVLSAK